MKPCIQVAVFLDGFVVKGHLSAPYRCLFDGKEGFIGIFVTADKLAAFVIGLEAAINKATLG